MTRPWLGTACRGALAVLLAATVLPATAPAAAAGDDSQLSVETYALPLGAPQPTLEQLQQEGGLQTLQDRARDLQAQSSLTAAETLGPASTHAQRDQNPAPPPPAVAQREHAGPAAGDAVYPEPSRKMTLDECREGIGGGNFYIKSRFAVCTGKSFIQTWKRRGRVIGKSGFNLRIVGTIAKNSRKIEYTYHFSEMGSGGEIPVKKLKISAKTAIKTSWPSTARYTYGGTLPGTTTFGEAKAAKSFTHTVTAKAGQGAGGLDTIFAVYEPKITVTPPTPWGLEPPTTATMFMLAPRWDAAKYLANSTGSGNPDKAGAATFSYNDPLIYHTRNGAIEEEVAKHIKKAFTKPEDTKPYMSAKKVPGQIPSAPLHRTRHKDRSDANGKAAIKQCKRYWGDNYSQGGARECDEYPFRSTLEGAAEHDFDPDAKKFNFSAQPVRAKDNTNAGLLLKSYYAKNRMLADTEDDAFTVKITN
ncbi:hypothetical protein [Streptomyces sp. KN37]|uniref:NucA/NucB deoxyribonuclease domain-containing protein n=1 Tax=Streptomyces sp. KN37 TaxID=3090667 RepID=UPI002A75D426|nr:hypothetical protein [Streptomyces sp. KN37]WPO70233.1 hypothetical protein R9806_06115 [Streptomyces sp. KN37]WPO73997.1 hypothetical protein R9806_26950 [Streptomyces sp. KN37]